MQSWVDRLANEVLVVDGGMGTYLYSQGVFINTCFDELNISNAELVRSAHLDYVRAGADIIETNSFGANRLKLAPYGLGEQVYQLNLAAARVAREAAGSGALVAGAIGPLGHHPDAVSQYSHTQVSDFYSEQVRGLIDGKVDLIFLETFSSVDELCSAIKGVRAVSDNVPMLTHLRLDDDNEDHVVAILRHFVDSVSPFQPTGLGLNCSLGPKAMLEALEHLRPMTDLPISIMPNAGLPQRISNRSIYMTSPEYMAEYAKRFIQTGAQLVGGCCGTHPEHIQAIRRAVNALKPMARAKQPVVKPLLETVSRVKPIPDDQKSQLFIKLKNRNFVRLVELVSPKGIHAQKQIVKSQQLKNAGIDAINIPDGPRASARMSAMAMALLIQQQTGMETVLHVACRDRNIIGMQSDLLGAWALGIRNILAITGDPPKLGNYPDATAVFDVDAVGLLRLLSRLNRGVDLANQMIGEPTGFSLGAGANPGAINLEQEIKRLALKVEAGAEYIVTQPVFDSAIFLSFVRKIKSLGVPIIVGIWPLVSYRNAEFMNNEVPGASVPDVILQRMRRHEDKEGAYQEGIMIARETLHDVIDHVAGVQLSAPLGRIEGVLEILSKTS